MNTYAYAQTFEQVFIAALFINSQKLETNAVQWVNG